MWLTHLRLQVECSDPAQQGGEFNLTRIHLASYSFFSYSSYSPSPASKLVRSLYVSLSPNLVSRANPACYSSSRPRGSCSFMRDQRSATDSRPVLRKPAAFEASTSKRLRQASLYNGGDSVWQYEAHHERCPPPTLRDTLAQEGGTLPRSSAPPRLWSDVPPRVAYTVSYANHVPRCRTDLVFCPCRR